MRNVAFAVLLIVGLMLGGCIPKVVSSWGPGPMNGATVSNESFDASIEPLPFADSTYNGFVLTINNKTTNDIQIDWNRTMFIDNGSTNGTFMFEGVNYAKRNDPKAPDIAFPGMKFSRAIFPNALASLYSGYKTYNWVNGIFETGDYGVYLVAMVDGKEVKEKMMISVNTKIVK